MKLIKSIALTTALVLAGIAAHAQSAAGSQLMDLERLRAKVKDPDTRTRVEAFHQVWSTALNSESPDVKLLALELMREPVASASDHIRIPAVYAIAEIANSTSDVPVKSKALAALREPMIASQLPIRLAAIDALNSMMRASNSGAVALDAIQLLGEPVRSGNNGVRIPAINAVAHIAESSNDNRVYSAAIDLMKAPLDSMAMIGGMEVRMMAVVAVERLGLEATEVSTKAKASGMLQSYAEKESLEPEMRRRAAEGAARIQKSMNEKPKKTASGNQVSS
jgi:hypothetical protein